MLKQKISIIDLINIEDFSKKEEISKKGIYVKIPIPFKGLSKKELVVTGGIRNILELIDAIGNEFPELKPAILDENQEIKGFIKILVNGKEIQFLNGLNTKLRNGDKVAIAPAIAGG